MAKNELPPVLTQSELLSHGNSRTTVKCGELYVSEIIRFADFDFFGENFRSDHFIVILVTHGSIDIAVNLQTLKVLKDGFVVASPNVVKQLVGTSQNAKGMVVQFTLQFLNRIGVSKRSHDLIDYFSSHYKPVWDLEPADAVVIEKYIHNLYMRCEQSNRPFGREQLNHIFLAFLYEMAAQGQKYSPPLIGRLSRKEDLVIRFAHLVSNHFREQRSVNFYAEALNVTSKYLTETVKEISGKNARKIIEDFVIVESKLLLQKSELTIAQVSDILNFSDQSFFGKYFKRVTGISPKEFKINLHH